MQLTSILAHILLIVVLIYRRAWEHVPFLALIALLGLAGTPLLYYAYSHIPADAYFWLYYGIDALMGVLYLCCIFHLWRTPLDPIAFSQTLYLGIKLATWFFLVEHFEDCRISIIALMRPVNILCILFWAWVIWRYDGEERRYHAQYPKPTGPRP